MSNLDYSRLSIFTPKFSKPDGDRHRAQIFRVDVDKPIHVRWEQLIDY